MTDLFGQAPVHANRSLRQAGARRPTTNVTFGLNGFLSSPSAALQQSLESRLRQQLDGAGSTLFSLTWNRKATPVGRPYFQLVASALRTLGSDCGSWPTPDTNQRGGPQDPEKRKAGGHSVTLQDQVHGVLATGSPARTEKRGQLSPNHSRWLMGYSAEHLSCAPTEMPSFRKSRHNLSKPHKETIMNDQPTRQQLPVLRTGGTLLAIIPQSIEEAYRIANAAVKSGLVHRDMNTPERALMVIMHGMEIGLPPMASLERIAIINGRRCVWGDAVPALAMDTGELLEWDEGFTGEGENLEAYCRIARQRGKTVFRKEARFSVADAKQADLWDDRPRVQRRSRDGGTFEVDNDSPRFRYRKRMMQMRARVVFRDLFSDKFMGLYIAEEIVTKNTDAEMRDVTPKDFRRVENPMDDRPIEPTRTIGQPVTDEERAAATEFASGGPRSDTEMPRWTTSRRMNEMEADHEAAEAARALHPVQVDLEEAIAAKSVAKEQQPPQARTEPAGEPKQEGATKEPPKTISERAAAARGLPAKEPARATPQQEAGADSTGKATGRASAEPAAPAASPGDKFYQDGLATIANAVEAGALNGWWRSTRKERIAAGMTADQLDNLTQQYNRKFITLTGA